jgi:hypothetical protein
MSFWPNDPMAPEELLAERAAKEPNLLCFIEQFPLALAAIARIHDYSRGPLVKGDYRPSLLRHLIGNGEHPDHEAAVAWNALAALELRERARLAGAEETFPLPSQGLRSTRNGDGEGN